MEENETGTEGGESAVDELAEIAGLLGDGEGGEAGDAGGDEPEPKPAPKAEPKANGKPEEKRATWKEIRDQRKALDHREADLGRRARELEERERGLASKAERAALLDRLASKDAGALEALEQLGVPLDELIELQIATARGEKPKAKKGEESPEARKIRELEERLQAREASEAQVRAEAAFDEVASADPVLGKLPRARRVELGHMLAGELAAQGKPVPHPSKIPGLLVGRLRSEYDELREIFEEKAEPEEAPSKGSPSGSKTVSRQDSKVRGGPRATIRTDDEELADVMATLAGR